MSKVPAQVSLQGPSPANCVFENHFHSDSDAVPAPLPRLQHVGASYVVPFCRIAQCSACSLTFEIPTLPTVWPTHAELTRPTSERPWTRIDLMADVHHNAATPLLLLTCSPCGRDLIRRHGSEIASPPAPSPRVEGCCCGGDCWLFIQNSAGYRVACIVSRKDGGCTLLRRGQPKWEIAVHLDDDEPQVVITGEGRRLAQAEGRGATDGECGDCADEGLCGEACLQVDTEPEPTSPESELLVMCILAMIVFRSDHMPATVPASTRRTLIGRA